MKIPPIIWVPVLVLAVAWLYDGTAAVQAVVPWVLWGLAIWVGIIVLAWGTVLVCAFMADRARPQTPFQEWTALRKDAKDRAKKEVSLLRRFFKRDKS